jgi:cystathionine beta-lyase
MGGLVMWVNLIGLNATLTAYRKGQEWLDQVLEYLEGNRDFIIEYVKSQLPGVQMAKPEGTYLTWLDCRNTGIQGNPYEFFLKEAQVALNDGLTFGRGGEGFVRLNLACSREVLAEALERMKAALEKIAG